jgi:hypothetical protein
MLINAEDPYQDLLEEFEKIKPWKRGGRKRKKKKKSLILFYLKPPFLLFLPVNLVGKHVGVQ